MSVERIDLVRDSTMQVISRSLAAIAVNTGGYKVTSYADAQTITRMGLADKFFHIGDQIIVEKETAINATVGNTDPDTSAGITAAAVNADTFIAAVGVVHGGDYEFIYDGAEWHYLNAAVQLAEYGITVTGTPRHGDAIIVHETAAKLAFDVIGINHDTPSDSQYEYSLTLQLHDCIAELQFCARQALFAFPEGLAAGTYHFTIGAQPWYTSDVNKTVQFTLASAIAAGGQLVINNAYNATAIGSTISAFASVTASTAAETVTMSEGSAGTDLGTVNNAKTATVNSIQRALLGSNNWGESTLRQYLNSDKPAGQVWKPATKFDRPPSWAASSAGFLYGLDPEFVKVLGKVKKKTALNTVSDGGGSIETDEKVFLLSRSEIYAGDNITGGEGTPYAYYSMFSDFNAPNTGADTNRIKYRAGAAKYWWLRSPSVGDASLVCNVHPSGTFYGSGATYGSGVAPACVIV